MQVNDTMERRRRFEATKQVYESEKLRFIGVDGYDVYNVSIPFESDGRRCLFGRVERREEWARSWVRLFENTGKDEWTLAPNSMIYPLEDPCVSVLGGELLLGGTHVRYRQGAVDTLYAYFYRGTDPKDLVYFATGPDGMKDIRLVELADGRIGVFTRPKGLEIARRYGSLAMIGFTVFGSLDELTPETIEQAPYLTGLYDKDEWGGCNQAYLLDDGRIGVIGHHGYKNVSEDGEPILSYMAVSFVLDPDSREWTDYRIIATRSCYPAGPAKRPRLIDCVFAAGIELRADGKTILYGGIGDTEAGRIVIDNPFEPHGRIVSRTTDKGPPSR
ncbi:DUF1861 family protein [Cohnella fermenti]|uniref:DUF1861 family protein n=1 Tax=Cohnella fermenti TaxID=2565925 RepID=A0A4S4C9T2_9BACL|nr:DUF1861 family protein [Cohnella fermenti]THF84161.1 DUF1861 family protein [Cohnella fermenti]